MDKIDIDKIKTVPVDLYELSHVVENNIVKKKQCMINWLLSLSLLILADLF